MMKRILLAILFIFTTSVFSAVAIEKVKIGDLYYNLNPDDRTAEVTSQNNSYPYWTTNITTANILDAVEYSSILYVVTSIQKKAFLHCYYLTTVTIPNSVTSIGEEAFFGCERLTSVTLPNSVESIGMWAFGDCDQLKSPVYNVHCFAYLPPSYKGAYIIIDGIKSIAGKAFANCSALTSVTIPNSVTSIGENAFSGCKSLTSVTIPDNVTSIGYDVFDDCSKLKSPKYNTNCFVYLPQSYKGVYSIPDGIKFIAGGAFKYCKELTSITIPTSVISIGTNAFYNCSSLTSITIPQNIIELKDAFEGCTNLKELRYPRGYSFSIVLPLNTKLIAYDPTKSSTSTAATASSRSTSDTNSAITSRPAATQPSTPTTKPVTTPPAKLPECRIDYSKPENIYHSSSIRLCYSVDSELSDNQEIEFLIDGTPVEPKTLSQQKGVRPVQCTEVELDNMPTIANHVTKVSIRIADKRSRISWSEKSIALKYQSIHKPTLHVFAVGVNKYKAKGFDELRYAEKDACDFSKTIIDIADKNMYERVDTTVILGSRANRSYILEQLMKLEGRVKSNDIVMLFFSGHGKVENDKSYFITSDAEYVIQGLATRDIVDQIELMKKRSNVFVFMDACHSGATKTTERTKGNAKPITLAESEVIGYYSCAEKQESIEDENLENGVFTYALVKGLKGTAANEGQITIHELAEYIRKWVREKTNGRQSPTLDYQGDDYVIFYKKK